MLTPDPRILKIITRVTAFLNIKTTPKIKSFDEYLFCHPMKKLNVPKLATNFS